MVIVEGRGGIYSLDLACGAIMIVAMEMIMMIVGRGGCELSIWYDNYYCPEGDKCSRWRWYRADLVYDGTMIAAVSDCSKECGYRKWNAL